MGMRLWVYCIDAEELAECWGSRNDARFQQLLAEYADEFESDEDLRNEKYLQPNYPTLRTALEDIFAGSASSNEADPYRRALWILTKATGTLIADEAGLINHPGETEAELVKRRISGLVSIINADRSEALPLPIPVSEDAPISFLEASRVIEFYEKLNPLDILGLDKQIGFELIRIAGWLNKAACRGESMLFFVA